MCYFSAISKCYLLHSFEQDDFEVLRPAHALLEHSFDVQALLLAHFSVLLVLAISTSYLQ